jgi:hypothetical protein
MISKDSIKEQIYDLYLYMKTHNYHTDLIEFNNYTEFTTKQYIYNVLNDINYSQHLIYKNENKRKFIFNYNNDYILIYFEEYITNTVEFQIEIFNNLNQAIAYYDTL